MNVNTHVKHLGRASGGCPWDGGQAGADTECDRECVTGVQSSAQAGLPGNNATAIAHGPASYATAYGDNNYFRPARTKSKACPERRFRR